MDAFDLSVVCFLKCSNISDISRTCNCGIKHRFVCCIENGTLVLCAGLCTSLQMEIWYTESSLQLPGEKQGRWRALTPPPTYYIK